MAPPIMAPFWSVIELGLFRDPFFVVLYFPAFSTSNVRFGRYIVPNLAANDSELDGRELRIGRE